MANRDGSGREIDRLRAALQPAATSDRPPQVKLIRVRAPGVDVGSLGDALARWYETQGLEATAAATPAGMTLQCRTRDGWKRALGMGAALTTILRTEGADLLVEIGAAQWLGKGLAGGASLVAASAALPIAPVAWVTVGIGAWRQYRLPQQTIEFLQASAPSHQRQPEPPPPVTSVPPFVPPQVRGPVDVGAASAEEIAAAPGVGPALAEAIVAGRNRNGGYRSMSDVQRQLAQKVQPHEFRRLSEHLTVRTIAEAPPRTRTDYRAGRRIVE